MLPTPGCQDYRDRQPPRHPVRALRHLVNPHRSGLHRVETLGQRVADGHGVIVWVDYATGRSTPIPESLREAIRQYEKNGVE